MADAKIIQFGSRGQGDRGATPCQPRRSCGGAPIRDPTLGDADPGFESEDIPPTSALGALLSELARLASRIAREPEIGADHPGGRTELPTRCALWLHGAQTLGVDWEDSLEETVAFLRKRLSGDYAVDEFGFDPEFTTKIYLAAAAAARRLLVPGRGPRGGEPSRRWFGAAGLQPRRHLAARRDDLAHGGL